MRCPICLFENAEGVDYCTRCGGDLRGAGQDFLHDTLVRVQEAHALQPSGVVTARAPRPVGVAVISVLVIVCGVWMGVATLCNLYTRQIAPVGGLAAIEGCLAGLAFVVGFATWRGQKWIWWVANTYVALATLTNILVLGLDVSDARHAADTRGLGTAIAGTCAASAVAALLLAYGFRKRVRQFFRVDRFGPCEAVIRMFLGTLVVFVVAGILGGVFAGVKAMQQAHDPAPTYIARHPGYGEASALGRGHSPAPTYAARSPDRTYLERRAKFQTRLLRRGPSPQRWRRETPPQGVQEVSYPSNDLMLKAWLYAPQPAAGRKYPALVYFHGGFAFGSDDLAVCEPFIDAGFVVMTPMLRGENGNPGDFELFWGEVDDAKAAVRWLAQQPFVDSGHIYAFGHSVGGGISALLSLHEDVPLRHSGSAGGLYPAAGFVEWAEIVPFDLSNPEEGQLRVLRGHIREMKRPHYAYVGLRDPQSVGARAARDEAAQTGSKLTVISVPGDHQESLEPAMRQYLALVQKDGVDE